MRPRFFNRGESSAPTPTRNSRSGFNEAAVLQPRREEDAIDECARVLASMRPRLFNRGEAAPVPTFERLLWLQ